MLPDDVLLEIFNFCANIENRRRFTLRNRWHALVHGCRRWRYLVFASPRYLNLRLAYGGRGLVSKVLEPRPDPESRPLPSPMRFSLPALTELIFVGVYEYLEDLLAVARINAPLLDYLRIVFFMDLNFDVPQLHQLIGHVEEFKIFDHA